MEYSKLIGKQVFTQEGGLLGYVLRLYLSEDLSAAVCLGCADEEEEEFFLPFEAVSKTGDVLIAENRRLPAPEGVPCPVGKAVFDEGGNYLGTACALTSGSAGLMTVRSALGEKEYSAKRTLVKDTVILRIKSNTGSKKSLKKTSSDEGKPCALTDEVYKNNLMGKKLRCDIDGIAKEGDTVSAEMIARAHGSNRLLELTAAALKEL